MSITLINIMFLLLLLSLHLFSSSYGCGITTHIEISHRAKTFFKDFSDSPVDYAKLIVQHNDALMAGSPYPDAYYDTICSNGQYHNVSEDTHWAPFLKTTVDYINMKYPHPWDEATEKLVVFIFGIVSHQVADILWHSLGIDQGFLQTMGNINFHGSFPQAHSVGDIGGDVLAEYEMNTSYIPLLEGWYIPTQDLLNIYINYYNGNRTKMPENVMFECTTLLFLGRLAEALAIRELFPDYAKKSPFMVDQFEKFFIGGVDDMAGWTNRIWQQTITMIEKGTKDCDIPQSTLFLSCNQSLPKLSGYRNPGKNGYFKHLPLDGLSDDDLIVEKTLRGIRIKPSRNFLEKLSKRKAKLTDRKKEEQVGSKQADEKIREPDRVLFVKNDYARFGESYATGDLNSDGKLDLVVTAPGYGSMGSPQEGRVYIIYGDDAGIPKNINPDLDQLEVTRQGQILKGWGTAQSRFGSSVAVMDINLDGADDIAVGAPAFADFAAGDSPLNYNGYVLLYFGEPSKHDVARGAANITIVCPEFQYCNLGYSMTSGDLNNDGYPDLVIGTPFIADGGEQKGTIVSLFASKENHGYQYIDIKHLSLELHGFQRNSWFGYNMQFGSWYPGQVLFVSQPEYRICNMSDCSYSEVDIQSTGNVTVFYGVHPIWSASGTTQFSQTGWSVDIGSPFPDKNIQVIALSQLGADVEGSVDGVGIQFTQAGQVILFNTTSGRNPVEMKTKLQGDRAFERFGAKVQFMDLNNDGMSDLLIGAPMTSDDITELFPWLPAEQGQVYIYNGGTDFPYKAADADCGKSNVHPCPAYQATMTLVWRQRYESKIRFGSNFAMLKGINKRQLFVTGQHCSDYARLAGAIGVFDF